MPQRLRPARLGALVLLAACPDLLPADTDSAGTTAPTTGEPATTGASEPTTGFVPLCLPGRRAATPSSRTCCRPARTPAPRGSPPRAPTSASRPSMRPAAPARATATTTRPRSAASSWPSAEQWRERYVFVTGADYQANFAYPGGMRLEKLFVP
ncbi:hypothetical protein [Nannocystis pusilla]|uniref:hypothetical protein n=1 Tax=Nannocystis pusilla TaxID=889268 RepID=UPI003BF00AE6